jgi:hypothetical protein
MNKIEFENGSEIQVIKYDNERSHDDVMTIYSTDDKPVKVCYENNWNVMKTAQGEDDEYLINRCITATTLPSRFEYEFYDYFSSPAISTNTYNTGYRNIDLFNREYEEISDGETVKDANIETKHKKPFTCRGLL